ncbi:MAG TPA: ribosomal-processing cysteine protease Prp [Bacillota bacterium]|nr:ribosomal-processing cysteine protease Prp [Bacillota bacterium]
MIKITIKYDGKGFISRFIVGGHSGYDEAGKDIVCAAVSAVVQTAVLGLTDIAGIEPEYQQAEGHIDCILPKYLSKDDKAVADTILKTMTAGLKSIEYGYKSFISIEEKEGN